MGMSTVVTDHTAHRRHVHGVLCIVLCWLLGHGDVLSTLRTFSWLPSNTIHGMVAADDSTSLAKLSHRGCG